MKKFNRTVYAYNKGYRIDKFGNAWGPFGKKLKLSLYKKGYYSFSCRLSTGPSRIFIHQLQAYIKYGKKLFTLGFEARHLNSNSLDNNWDNIDIGSHSDNMMDKPKMQRVLDASHPKHNHKEIIKDKKAGMSYGEIMKKYKISSKGTISFIINKSLRSSKLNNYVRTK